MKTIKATQVLTAQVLTVEFAEKRNSYVVNIVSKTDDGGYKIHEPIWTNSSQAPLFTAGMSVNILPIKGKDGTVRPRILPA